MLKKRLIKLDIQIDYAGVQLLSLKYWFIVTHLQFFESFDRDFEIEAPEGNLRSSGTLLERCSSSCCRCSSRLRNLVIISRSIDRRIETKKKIQTGLSERVEPRNRPEIDPVDTCLDSQLSVQVIASRIRDSRKFVLGKWIDSK